MNNTLSYVDSVPEEVKKKVQGQINEIKKRRTIKDLIGFWSMNKWNKGNQASPLKFL